MGAGAQAVELRHARLADTCNKRGSSKVMRHALQDIKVTTCKLQAEVEHACSGLVLSSCCLHRQAERKGGAISKCVVLLCVNCMLCVDCILFVVSTQWSRVRGVGSRQDLCVMPHLESLV